MFVTFSPSLAAVPHIEQFLGGGLRLVMPWQVGDGDVLVDWGRPSGHCWPARYAGNAGRQLLAMDDGFLSLAGMGGRVPHVAMVADDIGIYLNAARPSRLEALIAASSNESGREQRTEGLVMAWQAARLSRYNHARDAAGRDGGIGLPERFVLVIDQPPDDMSIRSGLAGPASFRRMLEAALEENPDATVVVMLQADGAPSAKRGCLDPETLRRTPRVRLVEDDLHPAALLERSEAVYTVSSWLGFEGLLWGKPVRTFGMPFYAGWGLTRDELPAPPRRHAVSRAALIHATLVDYPRYVDPETGQPCEVERAMAYVAFQRRMRQRFPREVHVIGFNRLRRPMAEAYFQGSRLHYVSDASRVPPGATVAVWGRDACAGEFPEGASRICLEDGFLRSVGLGAELVQPLSIAMDRRGIYYDATGPSDLEDLLQNVAFDADLLARAASLRERLVKAGLTKYNVGDQGWRRPAGKQRVILVPGQVERDASIRYGAPGVRTNLALLQAVRRDNPDAYVVFKPHPDVMAGLRRKGAGESSVALHCDALIADVAMSWLLDQVDEVHVLTSLAGFEALLRGKKVVTYGQPFYAGWGLTDDRLPVGRRLRRLTLDELVAATLLLYPTYVSRVTGQFTTAENALQELLAWRAEKPARVGWAGRVYRRLKRSVIGLRNRIAGL